MCSSSAAWRKRLGSELTAVLKPDPRLLWDQLDQAVSAIDERPPDDPVESKDRIRPPDRIQSCLAFTIKVSPLLQINYHVNVD